MERPENSEMSSIERRDFVLCRRRGAEVELDKVIKTQVKLLKELHQ